MNLHEQIKCHSIHLFSYEYNNIYRFDKVGNWAQQCNHPYKAPWVIVRKQWMDATVGKHSLPNIHTIYIYLFICDHM